MLDGDEMCAWAVEMKSWTGADGERDAHSQDENWRGKIESINIRELYSRRCRQRARHRR